MALQQQQQQQRVLASEATQQLEYYLAAEKHSPAVWQADSNNLGSQLSDHTTYTHPPKAKIQTHLHLPS
jgi:hypothetical protein